MKGLGLTVALFVGAAALYIASPFVTAWSIREAIRNGDSAYLETAIDWPRMRETLKPSLSSLTLNLPETGTVSAATETTVKPSLWQRFKAYWAAGALNRAVDSCLTPEGLPQLFAARQTYRDYIASVPDDAKLPLLERIQKAWSRIKRAEFTAPATFEIDMLDKHDETRLYLGKLELTTSGWQLKELRIKTLTAADRAAHKFAAAAAAETPPISVRFGVVTPAQAAGAGRGDR